VAALSCIHLTLVQLYSTTSGLWLAASRACTRCPPRSRRHCAAGNNSHGDEEYRRLALSSRYDGRTRSHASPSTARALNHSAVRPMRHGRRRRSLPTGSRRNHAPSQKRSTAERRTLSPGPETMATDRAIQGSGRASRRFSHSRPSPSPLAHLAGQSLVTSTSA
jgi:hypothetical protein